MLFRSEGDGIGLAVIRAAHARQRKGGDAIVLGQDRREKSPPVGVGAIAVDKDTKPATSFPSDVPQLHAFYVGDALKAGDVISGVWIAEDVGDAAPKNTTIDEAASLKIKDPAEPGAFSLSKPTKGWPVGSYRVEISVNGKLAETVKFKIVK